MALQVELIEESFQQIVARKEAFAEAFYLRLFAEFPQVQPLFTHTDMHLQQHKLITTLAMIVSHLSHPEKLTQALRELGELHERYHVRHEHYVMVGSALLKTLADFLGAAWSPELFNAWIEAYGATASLMLASNVPSLGV